MRVKKNSTIGEKNMSKKQRATNTKQQTKKKQQQPKKNAETNNKKKRAPATTPIEENSNATKKNNEHIDELIKEHFSVSDHRFVKKNARRIYKILKQYNTREKILARLAYVYKASYNKDIIERISTTKLMELVYESNPKYEGRNFTQKKRKKSENSGDDVNTAETTTVDNESAINRVDPNYRKFNFLYKMVKHMYVPETVTTKRMEYIANMVPYSCNKLNKERLRRNIHLKKNGNNSASTFMQINQTIKDKYNIDSSDWYLNNVIMTYQKHPEVIHAYIQERMKFSEASPYNTFEETAHKKYNDELKKAKKRKDFDAEKYPSYKSPSLKEYYEDFTKNFDFESHITAG